MENVLTKEKCTGCSACMNICPKQAISMIENSEGFKYPVINKKKCVNCGLCKKTCPVLNTSANKSLKKCFVAYAKKDNYKNNSSSGGIFPLIATRVLEDKDNEYRLDVFYNVLLKRLQDYFEEIGNVVYKEMYNITSDALKKHLDTRLNQELLIDSLVIDLHEVSRGRV